MAAECPEGFADGGGVVREVFDEGDAVDFGADFEAALDALEGGEGFGDGCGGDALAGGEGGSGSGVEGVVLAGADCILKIGPGDAAAPDLPARAADSVAEIADAPVGGVGESVALDGAEGVAHTFGDVGAAIVGDDEAAARNEIDEALEGGFDGCRDRRRCRRGRTRRG